MTVSWTMLRWRTVAFARPTAGEIFADGNIGSIGGTRTKQDWYPWPYVEGLSLLEAINELAFLATGIYGKSMPAQNGAPVRLVVPWKRFKSINHVRFTSLINGRYRFGNSSMPKNMGFGPM